MISLNKRFCEEKYKEFGTLGETAKFLKISLETLRKFFIKENVYYLKRKKYSCNEAFFSEDNELSWYWAGFIAADGNIEKNKNRITIKLNKKDIDHLIKYKDNIKSTAPITESCREDNRPGFKSKYYYGCQIRFNSSQMVYDLFKFGIVPNKSKIYSIPEELFNNYNIKHFIRGLIDGDGWIKKETVGLCGNPAAVLSIFNYLKSKLILTSGKFKILKNGIGKFIFSRNDDKIKIINYLYDNSNVYLNRKFEESKTIKPIKIRKIHIEKSVLENLMHLQNIEIAKLLNVSNSTIGRKFVEYGLKKPSGT